jgi:hypothetical protein
MTDILWCPNCNANREVKMNINWIIFIILLLLLFIGAVIYLLYCYMKKKQCPVCGISAEQMSPMRANN